MIKFRKPDNTFQWAKVVSMVGHGLGIEGTGSNAGQPTGKKADGTGAVVLDAGIITGSTIEIIYPALSKKFSAREQELIIDMIESKRQFSLKYTPATKEWGADFQPTDNDWASDYHTNFYPSNEPDNNHHS